MAFVIGLVLLLAATLAHGAGAFVSPSHAAPHPAHGIAHDAHIAAGTDGLSDPGDRRAAPDADAAFFAHCPLCAPLPSAVAVPPPTAAAIDDTRDSRRAGLAPEPARRPPRA